MEDFQVQVLMDSLKRFFPDTKAEELFSKAIGDTGLEKKMSYSPDEMKSILDQLITYGGFSEFVARNLRVKLILGRNQK